LELLSFIISILMARFGFLLVALCGLLAGACAQSFTQNLEQAYENCFRDQFEAREQILNTAAIFENIHPIRAIIARDILQDETFLVTEEDREACSNQVLKNQANKGNNGDRRSSILERKVDSFGSCIAKHFLDKDYLEKSVALTENDVRYALFGYHGHIAEKVTAKVLQILTPANFEYLVEKNAFALPTLVQTHAEKSDAGSFKNLFFGTVNTAVYDVLEMYVRNLERTKRGPFKDQRMDLVVGLLEAFFDVYQKYYFAVTPNIKFALENVQLADINVKRRPPPDLVVDPKLKSIASAVIDQMHPLLHAGRDNTKQQSSLLSVQDLLGLECQEPGAKFLFSGHLEFSLPSRIAASDGDLMTDFKFLGFLPLDANIPREELELLTPDEDEVWLLGRSDGSLKMGFLAEFSNLIEKFEKFDKYEKFVPIFSIKKNLEYVNVEAFDFRYFPVSSEGVFEQVERNCAAKAISPAKCPALFVSEQNAIVEDMKLF